MVSSRTSAIIVAIIASIILYFIGFVMGLNYNSFVNTQVEKNIDFLKQYIDSSTVDLKNMQLQQLFVKEMSPSNDCRFAELYLIRQYSQLKNYWEVLPKRLEEYEHKNEITPEYESIKLEYTRVMLRMWLIARNNYNACPNTQFVPILYFYSKDCTTCTEQGEEFDIFKGQLKNDNKTVLIFPLDLNLRDDTVYLLKQYYNITKVPAILINDSLLNGRVFSSTELYEKLNGEST